MLSPVALELAPTATYRERECLWVPAFGGHPAHVVIRLRKTRGGKEEAEVYAVEEQHTGTPAREFLVEPTTHDTDDTYRVVIGAGWPDCTCTAGCVTRRNQRHSCKHRDALACLVGTGEV